MATVGVRRLTVTTTLSLMTMLVLAYFKAQTFLVRRRHTWALTQHSWRPHASIVWSSTLLGRVVSLLKGIKEVADPTPSRSSRRRWRRDKQKVTVTRRNRRSINTGRTSNTGLVRSHLHHRHRRFNCRRRWITDTIRHRLDPSRRRSTAVDGRRKSPADIGARRPRHKTSGRAPGWRRYDKLGTGRRSLGNGWGRVMRRGSGHVDGRLGRHEQMRAGTRGGRERVIRVTVDYDGELWTFVRRQQPDHFIVTSICYVNSIHLQSVSEPPTYKYDIRIVRLTFITRDAPIRQWPITGRPIIVVQQSADFGLIHKPDIVTLIPKTVSIIQIFYCIMQQISE